MRLETRQNLADARVAAGEILGLAVGSWQEDRKTALAVERLLMIVGEAFARVRAAEPGVLNAIADAHKDIGLRNVLAHGYDDLDPVRIAAAVEESLPLLVADLESLVGNDGLA
ncbi:MAG: DUF86 domain-containing protein [Fimbriimonadaceae bacterium]|nr:DUF86 domain-containing protein [Fimbriimonadaceae bacterium]